MITTKISSYEEVESLAKSLDVQAERMKNLLDNITRLYTDIGADGVWAGVSADIVNNNVNELGANFNKLSNAIKECSQFMMDSISTYRAVDEEINGNNTSNA